MCKYFQENVKELSLDYYHTLRRHNYVTPTSYLELILTFKTLLNSKRQEVDTMRSRYLTGLRKLEFAASQVSAAGADRARRGPGRGGWGATWPGAAFRRARGKTAPDPAFTGARPPRLAPVLDALGGRLGGVRPWARVPALHRAAGDPGSSWALRFPFY